MHISCMARKAGYYTRTLILKHLDETLFCKLKMLPDKNRTAYIVLMDLVR